MQNISDIRSRMYSRWIIRLSTQFSGQFVIFIFTASPLCISKSMSFFMNFLIDKRKYWSISFDIIWRILSDKALTLIKYLYLSNSWLVVGPVRWIFYLNSGRQQNMFWCQTGMAVTYTVGANGDKWKIFYDVTDNDHIPILVMLMTIMEHWCCITKMAMMSWWRTFYQNDDISLSVIAIARRKTEGNEYHFFPKWTWIWISCLPFQTYMELWLENTLIGFISSHWNGNNPLICL